MDDTIVARPFTWYGRMFMRLTAMVSRRQEFIADQDPRRNRAGERACVTSPVCSELPSPFG
jgi:hypothetical protein